MLDVVRIFSVLLIENITEVPENSIYLSDCRFSTSDGGSTYRGRSGYKQTDFIMASYSKLADRSAKVYLYNDFVNSGLNGKRKKSLSPPPPCSHSTPSSPLLRVRDWLKERGFG